MIAASLTLPFLLRDLQLPPEPSHQEEEDRARTAAAEAAIQAIERAQHGMGEGPGATPTSIPMQPSVYRQRIEGRAKVGKEAELVRKIDDIERRLRLVGLRAERAEFYRIARSRQLPDDIARKLVREVDLLESRFATA